MAENKKSAKNRCQICGRSDGKVELIAADLVRPVVTELIKKSIADWKSEGFICQDDLNHYRNQYIRNLIEQEKGELSELEKEVLESITRHEILSAPVDEIYESGLTFEQRLSDRIARFGGSWKFLILFTAILLAWVLINSVAFLSGLLILIPIYS